MRQMSKNTISHKHLRGFTLIELLVVISIIALLVSIMLPALSKARDSGKRIVCANNTKQLGLTVALYQTDWNEYFPPGWDGKKNWCETLAPYASEKFRIMRKDDEGYGVLYCPSNMDCIQNEAGYATNYVVNGHLFPHVADWVADMIPDQPWRWNQQKLSSLKNPMETFLFAENGKVYNCSPYHINDIVPSVGLIGLPHRSGTGCNLNYADGHTKFVTPFWDERIPVAIQLNPGRMFQ